MSKDAKSAASASSPMVVTNSAEAQEEEAPPQLDHPVLRDTDNSPTSSYEEALLRQYYGDPDENGVYGGCEE